MSGTHLGPMTKFSITVRQSRICSCPGHSQRRGWVLIYKCRWTSPALSFSGPSPARLLTIFYCFKFENPPQRGGPCPPGTGWPSYTPRHWADSYHSGWPSIIYRVSQEECARLQEGVPYSKVYRYSPRHLCPKLNGYGDNGQRSLKL
jgi:hypothetical protein